MRLGDIYRGLTNTVKDAFPTSTVGLPDATSVEVVQLGDGDSMDLQAFPVRKRLGDAVVRMLAYNGSIPGPEMRVPHSLDNLTRMTS